MNQRICICVHNVCEQMLCRDLARIAPRSVARRILLAMGTSANNVWLIHAHSWTLSVLLKHRRIRRIVGTLLLRRRRHVALDSEGAEAISTLHLRTGFSEEPL